MACPWSHVKLKQVPKSKDEVDEYLKQKWNHVFNFIFDANKKRDQPSVRKLSFSPDFKVLLKMSSDRWIAMCKDALKNGGQHDWEVVYINHTFALLDLTGDKLIDLSEYIEVMQHYGMARAEAIECFDRFAKGENGKALNAINYDQFCELWKEYFQSTNPEAPGNYLFGKLS